MHGKTYETVDELDIARALRVAVSSTVIGTSLVGRVLGHTTVSRHLREVDGTVETARQLRHINIEGELLVQQVEHLVLGLGLEEVQAGTDILAIVILLNERQLQGTGFRGGDSVGGLIICAINGTVLSARLPVRA